MELKTNVLYYGDNLDILRGHIPDGSVDLVYLDPPFNSNRGYNILFREATGAASEAQIEAFEDAWQWGPAAAQAYDEVVNGPRQEVAGILKAMVESLRQSDVTAYLCMMAVRLVELHRVLKPTGSLYLHCDPTAGPYLRVLTDSVFGPDKFTNEVVWKRTSSHNSAKRYAPVHDTLLMYRKSEDFVWNGAFTELDPDYVERFYRFVETDGRRFRLSDLTAPGTRHGESGKPWRGIDPTNTGRHWVAVHATLEEWDKGGRIYWPPKGKKPSFKRYLDEMRGQPGQSIWTDIPVISSQAKERLGYQTQKPLALLERIIAASSNEGEVVLDPFCGCGTAVAAAHKLGRRWIGIDITHLAIGLVRRRMQNAFPGIQIDSIGEPKDFTSAQELAATKPKQFEYWAIDRLEARPTGGKGPDLDGVKPFKEFGGKYKRAVISVKGTKTVNPEMIREVMGAMNNEDKPIGVLALLTPPTQGMVEAAAKAGFYEYSGQKYPRVQIITVAELLAGKQIQVPGPVSPFARAPRVKAPGGKQEGLGL